METHVILVMFTNIPGLDSSYFVSDISSIGNVDPNELQESTHEEREALHVHVFDDNLGDPIPEWRELTNPKDFISFQQKHNCLIICCYE